MSESAALSSTRHWVESFVIGLNLCPFATAPARRDGIRYVESRAQHEEEQLAELLHECHVLCESGGPETTLYVLPHGYTEFEVYLAFFHLAEAVLDETEFRDRLQIVSFHPNYLFENSDPTDPANATNQSPYPTIHLLKRADVAAAIASHPNISQIPIDNVACLRNRATQRSLRERIHPKHTSNENGHRKEK